MTPLPHWPGRLISLGDHEVYVRSVTPDDAPDDAAAAGQPALCVHGLEGSSRNWTDLMDVLRPRLDGDALDLPGFGDSPPRPDGRYSMAAYAQTIARLIERRGRGPVHLIGNSLSGGACVKLAATRPDLVRTLTLISPALPDPRPRRDLLSFPMMSLPWVGAWLINQVRLQPPERRVADVIATCYSDPASFPPERFAAEVAELTRRDALDHPTVALVGCARALTGEFFRVGRTSAWREAARVRVPALVIYGADDRVVDARIAGRAAHAFAKASARIVVLPRTGHLAHMEHPQLVAAEIGILLAQSTGGAAGRGQPGPAREFPLTRAG